MLIRLNRGNSSLPLTNDNYSEIKLYIVFHIEYKAIEFGTNKKEPTITFPIQMLERQRGSQ